MTDKERLLMLYEKMDDKRKKWILKCADFAVMDLGAEQALERTLEQRERQKKGMSS